jgi:hypothetical protein
MKNLGFSAWVISVVSLVASIVVLEHTYKSIKYRECVYEAINGKPLTKECQTLFDMRK